MTPPELLKKLQSAWNPTPNDTNETDGKSKRVESIDAIRSGGVAIKPCEFHIPPFDAIESEDPTRPGCIRSDCRLCGRFLGYRPKDNRVHFKSRG